MTGFIFMPPLVAGMDEPPFQRLFAMVQKHLYRANTLKIEEYHD